MPMPGNDDGGNLRPMMRNVAKELAFAIIAVISEETSLEER